ncbi:NADH-quinone oxidoreductase subunit C [Thalassobacillus hwangdonensis]|uniref:NADH-quinone oxidoreductase subunit C n=1 Tax=Thalassobacillus hwangdonensis TaxID=546108 RepID=A0ABW3L2A8_9BACI
MSDNNKEERDQQPEEEQDSNKPEEKESPKVESDSSSEKLKQDPELSEEKPKRKKELASEETSDDEKAEAVAKAKAKAAAAAKEKGAARKKRVKKEEEEKPLPPSKNQPLLDKYVAIIKEFLGEAAIQEHYINRLSKEVPTIVAKPDNYFNIAELLRFNDQLGFEYLSELHGTDFQTHMELYVHLFSFKYKQPIALKVKLDREHPVIPSLVPIWEGANWPECEAYDLLGIQFTGHPQLKRILLGEEWVGYPLRKDYEPHDVEV